MISLSKPSKIRNVTLYVPYLADSVFSQESGIVLLKSEEP